MRTTENLLSGVCKAVGDEHGEVGAWGAVTQPVIDAYLRRPTTNSNFVPRIRRPASLKPVLGIT